MEAPDFFVEDLLELPGGDDIMTDAFFSTPTNKNTAGSSSPTAVDSCNSSISGVHNNYAAGDRSHSGGRSTTTTTHAPFSGELCVPYDGLAELEWLSNFVEESFSSDDLHKLQFIPGPNDGGPPTYHQQFHPQSDSTRPNPIFRSDTMVPGKARSKLSRVAPSDWSTRLVMVAPTTAAATSSSGTTAATDTVVAHHNPKKASKRRDSAASDNMSDSGEVRRCLHCAAEKTPQWRTGPMGPKTLCNACGVRYKSGRLVPEYRPAASPTFVSAKHSNSHRKVLELRRQKDMQRRPGQGHQQQLRNHNGGVFGISNCDHHDYLIHHHLGPDFRQII